jgi:hypothetical protein
MPWGLKHIFPDKVRSCPVWIGQAVKLGASFVGCGMRHDMQLTKMSGALFSDGTFNIRSQSTDVGSIRQFVAH